MAFHFKHGSRHAQPNAEINMIPLIDVMLVLLIIFMVTAPLMTHAVKVDLPKASSQKNETPPETIQLSVKADGSLFWGKEQQAWEGLEARMLESAKLDPQPEIHLRADGEVAYKRVAELLATSARAGLTKVGFVTDPTTPRPTP